MTAKKISVFKNFLSLNNSDISFSDIISDIIFYVKIANPPGKSHPLFLTNLLKDLMPIEPPLFLNLVGGSALLLPQPLPAERWHAQYVVRPSLQYKQNCINVC